MKTIYKERYIPDDEEKALARLALRNAFWRDFSGLVNKYVEAVKGLGDVASELEQLNSLTSVYGRDREAKLDGFDVDVEALTKAGRSLTANSLLDALEYPGSFEIFLRGKKIFHRQKDGSWYFVGDE